MWPVLLNMTRDDCRRTLRRLELEAYSNMISVFRAQGALEDSRRRILQELRDVLHIGGDRHSAEARRVANDEILATIAEQLSGPNTGLDWISEGRRRVPLMPRGIPQTVFTELADLVALQAKAENEEMKKSRETERLAEKPTAAEAVEGKTETAPSVDLNDELLYPPVVMEDQTMKILEMEALAGRKRKVTETSSQSGDLAGTPVKLVKNLNRPTNQKHLNISQIYSNYSKSPSGKSSNQTKHSYNQVSKVSSKINQTTRIVKRRKQNPSEKPQKSASKSKKSATETPISSKPFNPIPMQLEFPPSSFQASYAQSVLGRNCFGDEAKSQNAITESAAMKLLTNPATTPRELEVSQPENTALQAQSTPVKTSNVKPCQFIIKKKPIEKTPQKVQISDIKILKKPVEGIKMMQKKQIIVAPNPIQKTPIGTGKVLQNKVIQNTVKTQPSFSPHNLDKMVVVSGNHPIVHKTTGKPKNVIITPSNVATPITKSAVVDSNSMSPKIADDSTPKGIAANDVKVSTKTFLLNPKSGQKMVVLPAKNKLKGNETQNMPMLQIKNMPATMKLVPVSSTINQITKSNSNITIVSRGTGTPVNTKVVGLDVRSQEVSKPKLQGVQISTKVTAGSPIMRPSTAKGSVIVVQKGASIGKTLTFSKSGGEMSKIVMGKNVNKLIKAQGEKSPDKKPGNVILLDLNDQLGPTTMSKIIDSHAAKTNQEETNKNIQGVVEETPVLFHNQMTEESCNANSLDSLSTVDMGQLEEGTTSSLDREEAKSEQKEAESAKDTSSVTDWEMELDSSVGRKRKGGSSSSLHLELCMSSDSETDAYLVKEKPKKKSSEEHAKVTEEPNHIFGDRVGLSLASRTLLSQLQDEGSSSNDSSFALKNKLAEKAAEKTARPPEEKQDKSAKDEAKTQVKRLDMFAASDMQLSAFGYLESDEGMMSGEDMFGEAENDKNGARIKDASSLDLQLSQFLGESSDVNSMPLGK